MGAPTTGTTGLGSPQDDLQNHTRILRQLKETTEVAQRQRGDTSNSFVKLGELLNTLAFKYTNNQLSFNGSTSSASGSVTVTDSISGAGTVASPLQLVNDSASPGNSHYYGTNGAGTKGWFTLSAGGSLTVTDGTHSVAAVTNLTFSGATVSGASPNATVTISGGGGGGGAPSTVPDLVFWFQSDVSAAHFTTGNNVPALQNSNPFLLSYTPTASALGASVSATLLNSLPVCTFPGTADSTYIFPGSSINGPRLPFCTVFVVFKPAVLSTQVVINGAAGGSLGFYMDATGHMSFVVTSVSVVGSSSFAMSAGTWYQANGTYNSVTGVFAFRVAQAAAGGGTAIHAVTGNTGGVGADNSGGSPMNADCAEIIVYNRVLTPTEITTVIEPYLHTKWGV
jgi:hypothetical protein